MLKVLENGQVLQQEKGSTFEQWLPIGMQKEALITVDKTEAGVGETINVSLTWLMVDLEAQDWVTDLDNQEAFNLAAGDQVFTVPVSTGGQVVSFPAAGVYAIGVRNPGAGSRDVIIQVTE